MVRRSASRCSACRRASLGGASLERLVGDLGDPGGALGDGSRSRRTSMAASSSARRSRSGCRGRPSVERPALKSQSRSRLAHMVLLMRGSSRERCHDFERALDAALGRIRRKLRSCGTWPPRIGRSGSADLARAALEPSASLRVPVAGRHECRGVGGDAAISRPLRLWRRRWRRFFRPPAAGGRGRFDRRGFRGGEGAGAAGSMIRRGSSGCPGLPGPAVAAGRRRRRGHVLRLAVR